MGICQVIIIWTLSLQPFVEDIWLAFMISWRWANKPGEQLECETFWWDTARIVKINFFHFILDYNFEVF